MSKFILIWIYLLSASLLGAQEQPTYAHDNGTFVSKKKIRLVFASSASLNSESKTSSDDDLNNLKGAPDFHGNIEFSSFELKYRDEVILTFEDRLIKNEKGFDIFVFNIKEMTNLEVAISEKGNKWITVGVVDRERPFVDIGSKADPRLAYKKLRLRNKHRVNGKGTNLILDAVAIGVKKELLAYRWYEIESDTLFLANKPTQIRLKDFSQWDGDVVRIVLDDKRVIRKQHVRKFAKKIDFPLSEGPHEFKMISLSEGFIKPNTVQLQFIVGDHIYFKNYRLRNKRSVTLWLEVL